MAARMSIGMQREVGVPYLGAFYARCEIEIDAARRTLLILARLKCT